MTHPASLLFLTFLLYGLLFIVFSNYEHKGKK
jgi:hypothetical protein